MAMCKTCLEFNCVCPESTKLRAKPTAKAKHVMLGDSGIVKKFVSPEKTAEHQAWRSKCPAWFRKACRIRSNSTYFGKDSYLSAMNGEVVLRDSVGDYAIIDADNMIEVLEALQGCARAQRRLKKP
jgi:hypothetical protein